MISWAKKHEAQDFHERRAKYRNPTEKEFEMSTAHQPLSSTLIQLTIELAALR
jgi:hypothetical protein